jgi:hypothetical protein
VVAEGWSLFLRFRGSIRESCPQDSESSISTRTCSKLRCSEHFWKMRSANVHDTVARARCHMTANSSPCGRVMLCFGLSLCECPKRLQTFFSFIFHSFIRSCIHSFQSFIRSFIYLFERSFVPSIHSFLRSFFHSVIHSAGGDPDVHGGNVFAHSLRTMPPVCCWNGPQTEQHGKNNAAPEKTMEIN